MTAPLRVGLAGLGLDGPQPPAPLSLARGLRLAAVADPDRRRRWPTPSRRPAPPGFADPLAMIAEAELDARRHRRPHDAARRRSPWRPSSAACRSSSRSRSPRRIDGGHRARRRRPRARGVPLQVGHVERFNPAVLELGRLLAQGLAGTALRDHEPARRPVPGPHPRRRRDHRPRHPRRRHPVAGSPASGRRGSTPRLAQRMHATHEDLLFGLLHFPSGATGHARRQLADAGEAAPARRSSARRACSSSTT